MVKALLLRKDGEGGKGESASKQWESKSALLTV